MTRLHLNVPVGIVRFFWHILFWFFYVLFFTIVNGMPKGDYLITFMELIIYLPIRISATYYSMYVLLGYMLEKRYTHSISLFILSIIVFTSLQYLTFFFVTKNLFYPEYKNDQFIYVARIIKGMINVYFAVLVFATIKLIKQWYFNQQTNQRLAQENLQAELNFLRAQIHPHFLFNTLNNLYALTLKKSDKAPEVVLKLSDLLNYMLYECNQPKASLSKELELIHNYTELERLRYGDRLHIETKINGDPSSIQVAPMLVLPFVENAFKHGISESATNTWIKIEINIFDQHLQIIVDNSKETVTTKDEKGYREGIGLKNVRRRLELIYPEKYELEIEDKITSFYVCLDLELI